MAMVRLAPKSLAAKKAVFMCSAGVFVASVLYGCGCDEDAASRCLVDNPWTNTSFGCSAYKNLAYCISDAGCCEWIRPLDGATMKDVLTHPLCTNPC
mmetsp:Transcript_109617/g.172865  ORF Transcript_109617/g.172865 Transcript_109617/m.172865 type:complete len:97 (-) Transcript_109617:46-336(-)